MERRERNNAAQVLVKLVRLELKASYAFAASRLRYIFLIPTYTRYSDPTGRLVSTLCSLGKESLWVSGKAGKKMSYGRLRDSSVIHKDTGMGIATLVSLILAMAHGRLASLSSEAAIAKLISKSVLSSIDGVGFVH